MKLISLSLLASVCSAVAASAQDQLQAPSFSFAEDRETRQSDVWNLRSGFLERRDDAIAAGGIRYKARFDEDGVEFLPALGSAATRDYPMKISLQSVGRRFGDLVDVAPARIELGKERVDYVRQGFVERYDVRDRGIEQSFVFDTLPEGEGDLVVRCRLESDLDAEMNEEGGLTFELPGVASMSIGAVTGIDASGLRASGSLILVDGCLELSLPGVFVDQAQLPLTLDPIIGSIVDVEVSANDRGNDPEVAYDAASDVYCVVWEEWFSSAHVDVRARRVSGAGVPLGTEISVTTTFGVVNQDPAVGNCAQEGSFVIAWSRWATDNYDIWGRSMDAGDGALGSLSALRVSPTNQSDPAVGGTLIGNSVYLAFLDIADVSGEIDGIVVDVLPDGSLSSHSLTQISVGSVYPPRISQSAGPGGRHFVTYYLEMPGFSDVRGRVISTSGVLLTPELQIANSVMDEDSPAVDGDGTNWIVAYETQSIPGDGNDDIACRTVAFHDGTAHIGTEIIIEADVEEEGDVSVAWNVGSVIVAYEDEGPGGSNDVHFEVVDPFTAQSYYEGPIDLNGAAESNNVCVASAFSGSGSLHADGALVVWENVELPDDGTIFGRTLVTQDGLTTDLGGGCGNNGGEARAAMAARGNSNFRHHLREAAPSSTAALLFSFDRIDASCGACTIVPDPFTGFAFSTTTNALGVASLSMPIPYSNPLLGLEFFDQWIVLDGASPECSALNADISTAISVEIQD